MLLRITGALGSDETPDEWTIQPFDYRPTIQGANGIPPADNGVVFNDTNGDLVADSPYDVTLSQQWNATVAPNASVVLESSTRFDAEDRSPTRGRRLACARAVTRPSTSTFAPTTAIPTATRSRSTA